MCRWVPVCGVVTTGIESIWGNVATVRMWTRRANSLPLVLSVLNISVLGNSEDASAVVLNQLVLTTSSWLPYLSLPNVAFVPYPILASCILGASSRVSRASLLRSLRPGSPTTDATAALAVSCCTVLALCSWSARVEDHGAIQDILGPALAVHPAAALPAFIALNPLVEEVEFRGFLMEALLRKDDSLAVVGAVIFLQAFLFAIQHYKGGFPCGRAGFLLVFLWALVLGSFRYRADGSLLVYLIHVVADATIAVLIRRETKAKRRRRRRHFGGSEARGALPPLPARPTSRRRKYESEFVEVWSHGGADCY